MSKESNSSFLMRFDVHHRLIIAVLAAAIVFGICFKQFSTPALIMVTWVTCASIIIIMDWLIILSSHPREVRKIARLKDSSRFLILLFVITASSISLFSILFLLRSGKADHGTEKLEYALLSVGAVIVSWWMLHTIFTMSYAHLYYTATPNPDDGKNEVIGGLEFPADMKNPDYLDFVYFSFVVGMTFQVSDVEISSRSIRRLVLLHGIISFAFNTAIVALSINVVAGLV